MDELNVIGEVDLENLARVLGAVDHWREILCLLRPPDEKTAYLQITEYLQRRLGEGSYLRARQEGRSLPVEGMIQAAKELLEALEQPRQSEKQLFETGGMSTMLSERERQVIGLIAEGLTNQEI